MPPLDQLTRAISFLRAENPMEDISKNPVIVHPHNTSRAIPERLPAAKVKELSVLQPASALARHGGRLGCDRNVDCRVRVFLAPGAVSLAVMVIGSRQHALLILGHDASHYRYLPTRWQNDLFANLFLMWPTFASVEGFRVSRHASPIHKPARRR